MPIGFGDGGLGGRHREYTNVYWTLAGLESGDRDGPGTGRAGRCGWQAEYDDYWQAFDRAAKRDKLTDAAGNTYVPVTMQGEQPQLPQRGAWAFLQSIFPGRVFPPDDPLMPARWRCWTRTSGKAWSTAPAGSRRHLELRRLVLRPRALWLGHGHKAAATLYAFGNHASPLLTWREEQRPVGERPHYVGDMPHNWASAEFIRLVRHLLVLERGDELHLFEGLPRAWTKAGCVTELKAVPTTFGEVSLKLAVAGDGRSATLTIDPPNRDPRTYRRAFGAFRPACGERELEREVFGGPGAITIPTRPSSRLQVEFAPPAS